MKLYAIVSSERASKGQGGNKFLKFKLTAGSTTNPQDVGTIVMEVKQGTENEYCHIYYNPRMGASEIIAVVPLKGEKQKGDICNFGACKNKAVFYGVCNKHKDVEK